MKKAALIVIVAFAASAWAVPTVTLTLETTTPTVAPGGTMDWTLKASVSGGDNEGLALVSVDLVQDAGNPLKFDLPPATAVPAAMVKFARPQGIANPDEAGKAGYLGVQRGAVGEKNLVQIGGGQNTFGTALAGAGIAENAVVAVGVGQGTPVVVASGSLTLTGSTNGQTFTFSLGNGLANVLNVMNPDPVPPAHWPVTAATVVATSTLTVTVGQGPVGCKGNANCDSVVSWRDIDFFIAGLNNNQAAWAALFPPPGPSCPFSNLDCNNDGNVTWRDIDPFIALLNTTCP